MIDVELVTKPCTAPAEVDLTLRQIQQCVAPSKFTRRFEELLSVGASALDRTHRPGHLTGSAFVISADRRRCLMMFHSKLQRWLQPGGHADGDGNLVHVALREATEETGIEDLVVFEPAIDLDIHRVEPPTEDPHLHFDVRFLVIARANAIVTGNHESEALRWVPFEDIRSLGVDDGLLRLAEIARDVNIKSP